ncbi:bacteriocin, lactococcin 972 family [Marininema mesophilum]|uniref:Bacteriocin, lactococcin 972 family n=1 Tax=Marininema mesophilum TaxID=1048340 RepID=A0A1H2QHY0_9BACL|nr:lactococcin 972 family bacteriocin [Marininema mesophilum]SDW06803.1 bacteriocin, lactococcin 972 family [Marininema mesophilum]
MNIKKSVVSLVLCGALFTVGTTVAFAEVTHPGGGVWSHGTDSNSVWSEYYHGSKTHKSSVQGVDFFVTSGWKSKGVWSTAWHKQNPNYMDYAFWSVQE